MAYPRRRHYGPYYDANWKEFHERRRASVSAKYGGIDGDVRAAFFSLDSSTLTEFFKAYKTQYGSSAATYARKTYTTWKSGEIEPSGQTSERLLETLPAFLSFETKCALLQKLRDRYRNPESHQLTLSIYEWRSAVLPLVQHLIINPTRLNCPKAYKADWRGSPLAVCKPPSLFWPRQRHIPQDSR